jgi:hypothetical protein
MAAKSKTTAPLASGSLRERILKASTVAETATLEESLFFKPKDHIKTAVPMLNVAFTGEIDGGMIPGVLMIAGPSKHFKTGFALLMAKSFLDKHVDGIILFYDSEFGSPQSYFTSYGIPLDRVIHTPITDVEQVKHDMMTQLQGLTSADHVMIIMDSIGNLASIKEVEDALKGDTKADFTRAKALKSLFRMITPHLTIKGIPFVAVNHSYKTIEMYSRDQVGGGTGGIYAANDIWIIGRSQDKDDKGLHGWNFTIKVEKSRFVKEQSKIPITISFEEGILRWSGLFDLAKEFGIIVPATGKGRANTFIMDGDDPETGSNFKRDVIENNGAFWNSVLTTTNLKELIKDKYKLPTDKGMLEEEESINPVTGEVA